MVKIRNIYKKKRTRDIILNECGPNPEGNIFMIISHDEVEDQFLRLKAVLGCHVRQEYCTPNYTVSGRCKSFMTQASRKINDTINKRGMWHVIFIYSTSDYNFTTYGTQGPICQDYNSSELKKPTISTILEKFRRNNMSSEHKKIYQVIEKEINQIKYRIENMFPVKVKILNLNEIVIY